MALVLVLMLAFYGVHSASLPMLPNPSDSSEGRLDALAYPSDVSEGVLMTLAPRSDIDAITSQRTSDRQADSDSEDAQSGELRTPEAVTTNPLDALASKLETLSNPLDLLDGLIDTLASEKVRRSVIDDVKHLIENKFTTLLEDGVKRITGKKGILKKELKVKPTSLVLKLKERDPDSTIEEEESQNSGMIKVLTDGPLKDSDDVELRNVVDELLREDEDRTIEEDTLDSNEDHLNVENSMKSHNDASTIEDYDDNSESSKKTGHVVEENLLGTSKNEDKTEVLENILDLDEILKSALKDLSDSLSQEIISDDNDEGHNLTTNLDVQSDKSDEKLSEIDHQPQKIQELEERLENILRNGADLVKNGDDGSQAYKASDIEIDENVLQTERSSSNHKDQEEDDEQNPENWLRQGQNLGNFILVNKNKTTPNIRNSNEYTSSETVHPRQSDKPIDAHQSLNIKENDKNGNLKHDHEQSNFNKVSENKYSDQLESTAQPETKNVVKAYNDNNRYLKGETKHVQQYATQHQTKKHHHHHHHYHPHHHKSNNPNKLTINISNSGDLSMSKTDATQEKIHLDEHKNDNIANTPNHPKQEIEEKDNVTEKIIKGFEEENNLTDEKDNVTKERKNNLKENENIHEENNASKEKTSESGKVLENETSETRIVAKHTHAKSTKGFEEENNLTDEKSNITNERKSNLEENKNTHEEDNVTKEKTSESGKVLENETSETRIVAKHTETISGQSNETNKKRNNLEELTDEIEDSRSGMGKVLFIMGDNEKTEKVRKGTEMKGRSEEEDVNITDEDDVTAEDSGCHNKNHHKRQGKSNENDETNVLQDLMHNADKIKSYTLSMTFTTRK